MRVFIDFIVKFSKEYGLWSDSKHWDGGRVTNLWDGVWQRFDKYLNYDNTICHNKTRKGEISWRTYYNKLWKAGLFKGNKVRKPKNVSY